MNRQSNGPFAPPRDWDALQHAYEAHTGDLEDLAGASSITLITLNKYAKARKWVRSIQVELPVPVEREKPKPKSLPEKVAAGKAAKPKQPRGSKAATGHSEEKPNTPNVAPPKGAAAIKITSATRAEIIGRLYAAIFRKVEQLEICMSTDEPVAPTDHERETRIIGTLLRNVELVDDVNRPASSGKPNADTPKSVGTAADRRVDTEHLRRELAARIKRLRERQPG